MKKVVEDNSKEEKQDLSAISEKTLNTQLLDSLDQTELDTLLKELLLRKQASQNQTKGSTSSSTTEKKEQLQPKLVPFKPVANTSTSIRDEHLSSSSSDDPDDYIRLYYNYNGMNSHLFRLNERVENVLKYFFAIRSGFDDEDTSDYCLVTKANLTRTLPIYKTIEEVGLEDGMQVESILLKIYSEL